MNLTAFLSLFAATFKAFSEYLEKSMGTNSFHDVALGCDSC
jgi:hypothetical protein